MGWKYMQYDGETGKKRTVEGGGGGGSSTLAGLDDVLLTALTNGDIFKWNATDEKFENSFYKNSDSIYVPAENPTGVRIISMQLGNAGATNNTGYIFTLPSGQTGFYEINGIVITRYYIAAVIMRTNGSGNFESGRLSVSRFVYQQSANPVFTVKSDKQVKLYDQVKDNDKGIFIGMTNTNFTVTIGE